MYARSFFLLFLALLLHTVARGDEARLRCIADTNLSSYDQEREFNYGRSTRLRLKGIQMLALFRFDTGPVSRWKVQGARLFLRYAGGDRYLRTLGFSTVAAPWEEGTGAGEPKPGEACFAWREHGRARWAGPDTDFTDVSFTTGHTRAAYADTRDEGNGWISVAVDPDIVQAMIAGVSEGMAVTDEKGQTMANNDVYSREQSGSEPYLVVVGAPGPAAGLPPVRDLAAAPEPSRADFAHGALRLAFTSPPGAFAYTVRYTVNRGATATTLPRHLISLAMPGRRQVVNLPGLPPGTTVAAIVQPLGETGARGTATAIVGRTSSARLRPEPLSAPPRVGKGRRGTRTTSSRLRLSAYPDTEKADPLTGRLLETDGGEGRDAAVVSLFAARSETVAFHLLVETDTRLRGVRVQMTDTFATLPGVKPHRIFRPRVALYRDWYVRDGSAWFSETCVPLAGPFDIPTADNGVPDQKNQSVLVELHVPRNIAPGRYTGKVTVSAEDTTSLSVPVRIEVNPLVLPDRLSFDVSLNAYGTVAGHFGLDERSPEYLAVEREYHRMAHAHRATYAPLGYSQGGNLSAGFAPPLAGEGTQTRVTDWSVWDSRFGPLLDGSAFADLPRGKTPVTHLYLPFHEAWPVDIRRHYRYTPTTKEYPAVIIEHAMKAPPVEQAFTPEYRDAFTAVVRQFAEHLTAKGWTRTNYQFYLNNKYFYRDPRQGGSGTSWWLLDEPNHRDDWLALAFFARMLRAGTKGTGATMLHREDISRPQWQRDWLDGLVDLMVLSGELYTKGPLLRDMRERLGVTYWNYGTANAVGRSNVEAEAWAVRAWLAGADGIVPWQTIGGDDAYTRADETALLLPGKRFGIAGPIASLRLKALRRAQQDVEYLNLLAAAKGWDREQTAAAVSGILKLQGRYEQRDAEDAGHYRFGPLRAADFRSMRQAIAAVIAGGKPDRRRKRGTR